jgi:hypothetical protein
MNRRSHFLRFRLMSGVGAVVAGIAFFAVPSQAAHAYTGCSDCYVVTPATAPATSGAGTGQQYAFQVTNNDPHETLKSLTFTAPADFVITGASGPSGTSVSAVPGSSVTLKLPSEPTGSTFTVNVTALAPCVAASSEVWGVSGIDSLGETNEVQWSSSPLSVSVTGECSLAFTGQPAQTAVNSDILTGFNSTGSPLAVRLSDANKNPLNQADFSASGTQVTISIETNPGGGTLAGTTTVASSNGVADFGNLQISKTGAGYDLAASASGFIPATSAFFTISGQIQVCGGTCSASQSTATTATSITTSSAADNFAALGLGGVSLTCNHYKAVSDAADFGIFNSTGGGVIGSSATATLTLSKSAVESSPRPLLLWQVCYASPTFFPVVPGTSGTTVIGGITYHTGLLLPCILFPPGHKQPCLISQRYTATGGVQLTFVALGDPVWRG